MKDQNKLSNGERTMWALVLLASAFGLYNVFTDQYRQATLFFGIVAAITNAALLASYLSRRKARNRQQG